MSDEATKRLARKYNDALLARGDHSKEWFVNSSGTLQLRFKTLGQRRFDLGEKR